MYPNPAEMPAAGGFGGGVQTYILFFSILRADKKNKKIIRESGVFSL